MEKMKTRERKKSTTNTYSPPRPQITPKKIKPKTKATNNNKNKTQPTPKNKKDSQPKVRSFQIKNDPNKGIDIQAPNPKKKNNNTDDKEEIDKPIVMPENWKVTIPQDIWNSWSNIRRASFKQIKNPNSFFYRNRPPGDPQKYGPFTSAEEKQFIQRLKYFREELGINDGLWGYFSVPILGRVGYQCSNFYRSLILSGKIIDSSYELMSDGKLRYLHGGTKIGGNKPPEKVIRILDNEAFTFIKKCFDTAKEEGEDPKVLKPITVKQEKSESEDAKNEDESESDKDEIIIQIGGSDIQSNKEISRTHFNSEAINNGKKRIVLSANKDEDTNDFSGSRGRRNRKSRFYDKSIIGSKGPSSNGRNKSNYGYSIETNILNTESPTFCPLIGAIDPFSNLPIEKPMMDPMGVVMDRSSWKKIFSQKLLPPLDIAAFTMGDLIEINPYNYDEYRYYISNFVC